MGDVKTKLIWSLQDNVSAGTAKLKKELAGVGVTGKNATGVMSRMSIATGGLVTPQSLAAAGALAFAGALAGTVRAAIDEEKNIRRLDAALRANVDGWNGNTDAIEAAIAEREKLAFSDDELRDSLTGLVGATKDVTKALDIQSVAMDLARFKDISLKEASEALVKVEAGQFRMLKSLGIELEKGATQTDALAAVQRVAAGQAKEFGESTEGAMVSAGIAIEDVAEDIGEELMPVVRELALFVRDDLIPIIRGAATAVDTLATALGPGLAAEIEDLHARAIEAVYGQTQLTYGFNESTQAAQLMATAFWQAGRKADTAGQGIDDLKDDGAELRAELKRLRDVAKNALDPIIEAVYGPAILAGKEAGILQDIKAVKEELSEAKKKGDALEITRLRGQLAEARAELVETRGEMAHLGIKPAKDNVNDWLTHLITRTKRLDDVIIDAIQDYKRLGAMGPIAPPSITGGGSGSNARAAGGPVVPGQVYRIGEYNRETLYMGARGGWIDADGGRRPAQGGSNGGSEAPVIVQVNLDGRQVARIVDKHLYYDLRRASPTLLRT